MLAELFRSTTSLFSIPPGVTRDTGTWSLINDAATGYGDGVEPPVNTKDYVDLQGTHGVVEKCVRLNARAVAQGKLRLYRALADGEEEAVEEHPIADLFERVNEKMTSFDLIEYTVMSLDLAGNAYWELVRKVARRGEKAWLCGVECEVVLTGEDGESRGLMDAASARSIGALLEQGPLDDEDVIVRLKRGAYFRAPATMLRTPVVEIWPLNPARMKIEPSKVGPSVYRYEVNGKKLVFAPEQVLHFKNTFLANDFYGLTPLQANVNTLVSDQLQEKANTALLRNAARPSGIMTYEKDASDDAIQAAVAMFKAVYSGSENAGKVLHVAGGREFKPLSISSADLQSFDRARWNKSMIQQALDLYPIVYGLDPGDTSATRENSETQVMLYLTFGVMPRAERIERTVNELLMSRLGMGETEDLYLRFDFSRSILMRQVLSREAANLSTLLPSGAILPDEIRLMLAGQRPEFKPLPWGRKWFGAGFTIELGDADRESDEQTIDAIPVEKDPSRMLPAAEDEAVRTQEDALNGAQVSALLSILSLTAAGQLPREAAIGAIMVCFNLSREEAELVLGPIGTDAWKPEPIVEPGEPAAQVAAKMFAGAIERMVSVLNAKPRALALPDGAYRNLAAAMRRRETIARIAAAPNPGAYALALSVRALPPVNRVFNINNLLAALALPEDDSEIKRMQSVFAAILEDNGKAALAEIGVDTTFHADSPALREWLKTKTITFAQAIDETTTADLRAELLAGLEGGETYQKLAVRVNEVFEGRKDNALTVARTETAGAANKGRQGAYTDAELVDNEWLTMQDEHVRDSHKELDGEVVTVGDRFSNGQEFPGDTRTGDVAGFANCRCTVRAIIPGLKQKGIRAEDESIRAAIWRAFDQRTLAQSKSVARQYKRILDKQRARIFVALKAEAE